MNWRKFAEQRQWQRISYWRVPDEDLEECFAMLCEVVPVVEKGDGIEVYRDFLSAAEAKDEETYHAAWLLDGIRSRINRKEPREGISAFLQEAVSYAEQVLLQHGIEFEGMHSTYIYWDADGQLVQLRQDIGAALFERTERWRNELVYNLPDESKVTLEAAIMRNEHRLDLYPWRRATHLYAAWRAGRFPEYSAIDHAIALLNSYHFFQSSFWLALNPQYYGYIGNKGERGVAALHLARSAFQIGREYEALRKKPFEIHAIRGIKTVKSASAGGETVSRRNQLHRENVLSAMRTYVEKGFSVSRAADLVARSGLGTSRDANRKLWDRHSKLGHRQPKSQT